MVITVYAVQAIRVDELPGGRGKGFPFGGVCSYLGILLAASAAATDGEDDLEVREALLERGTGTQTAICTVDFNLIVGPIVFQLLSRERQSVRLEESVG